MMTGMTEKQEAMFNKYRERMTSIPNMTRKMNRKRLTDNMKKLFNFIGKPFPNHVVITRSPIEAQYVANYLNLENFHVCIATHSSLNNHRWVKDAVRKAKIMHKTVPEKFEVFNACDYILHPYAEMFDYFRKAYPSIKYGENDSLVNIATDIRKYTQWVYMFDEVVIVSMNPIRVEMEDGNVVMQEFADGYIADTRK